MTTRNLTNLENLEKNKQTNKHTQANTLVYQSAKTCKFPKQDWVRAGLETLPTIEANTESQVNKLQTEVNHSQIPNLKSQISNPFPSSQETLGTNLRDEEDRRTRQEGGPYSFQNRGMCRCDDHSTEPCTTLHTEISQTWRNQKLKKTRNRANLPKLLADSQKRIEQGQD
jgi:hypothetical protein